jgi:hypothetical protein
MSTFKRDFETDAEARARMARDDQADPLMVETDVGKVLEEPARESLVIKPGRMNASRAFRRGREDEYSDRMRSKYGGEW